MLRSFNNSLTTILNSKMSGSILFCSSYLAMLTLQNKRKISTVKHTLPKILDFTNPEITRKYWESRQEEHSYLEEVLGDKAITWVKDRNNHSLKNIGNPKDSPLYDKFLNILDSKDKIPHVSRIGEFYYNFWKDINNTRGILRRTTLMSFKSDNTTWQTVVDIDLLGKNEKESWVYGGYSLLKPDYNSEEIPSKIILHLSRGGADAQVLREFDLNTLAFVTNDPFNVPESKSRISWKSNDLLLIGTDLSDGKSLTDSGYPRVVREWKRGTPLEETVVVFEGDVTDVSVTGYMYKHRGYDVEVYDRGITFYTSKKVVKIPGSEKFVNLDVPDDAEIDSFFDQLLISLRSDWSINGETYISGSLLSVSWNDFVFKSEKMIITQLFTPEERVTIESFTKTKKFVIIDSLDNVKSRLIFWKYIGNNSWTFFGQENEAVIRGTSISAVDKDSNDFYWLTIGSFITPSTLYLANCNEGVDSAKLLKNVPPQFDASDLEESQGEAISADGTKIPYFMISKKGMKLNGTNPTL
jgi:prolyl oligopeptidase